MPTPQPPDEPEPAAPGQEGQNAPAGAAAEEAPQQEQEAAEPMEEAKEEDEEQQEVAAQPGTATASPAAAAPAPTPAIPSSGIKRGPRSSGAQPARRPSAPPALPAEVAPRLSARQAAKRQRQAVAAMSEEADEKTAAELLLGMQSLSNSQGDSDSPAGDQHATADHPPRPPSGRKHQLPAIPPPAPLAAALPSKVSISSLLKTNTAGGSSALPTPELPRVPSHATSGAAPTAASAAAAAPAPAPPAAAAEPKKAPTPATAAGPPPAPDAAATEAAAAAETTAVEVAAAAAAAEAAAAAAEAAAAAAAAAEAAGLRRSARPKKDKSMGGDFSTGEEASGEDTHSEDEYAPTSGHRQTGPRAARASSSTPGAAAAATAAAALAPAAAAAPSPTAVPAAAAATAAAGPSGAAAAGPAAAGPTGGGGGGTITTLVPQKSELTLLCERFQQQFGHLQPDGSPTLLMLNDVAEVLGVPRRRLYDVINVFESIEVMRRVGKLMYEWMGFDHLPSLLEQLAAEEESGVPVEDRIRRAPTIIIVNEQGEELGSSKANSHSLWVLSRRLVRMLLKHEGPIALTSAAAILVGPGGVSDPSQHRSQTQITVERRLYDIGSILCSIGLIARIYVKKRQPAFEWTFGWKPGDSHPPPKLANSYAPTEGLILNKAPAGLASAARKRPTTSRAGTFTPQHLLMGGTGHPSGSKRHKGAHAATSGGVKISGLVPIDAFGMGGMGGMMMMHPGAFMMAPGGAAGMAAMGGMGMGMPLMGMQTPGMAAAAAAANGASAASGAGDKQADGTAAGAAAAGGAAGAGAGLPGAAMFFPPHGAFFANPMALGMGGMLNPALALQQAQQVMGGLKPEAAGGEDGESSGTAEAAAAAIQAAQQQQALAALRAVAGLPPDTPLDLGIAEPNAGEMSIAALAGGSLPLVPASAAGDEGKSGAAAAAADLAAAATEGGQAASSGEEAVGPSKEAAGGEGVQAEQHPAGKDTEMANAEGPAAAGAAGAAAAAVDSAPAAAAAAGGSEGGGSKSEGESDGEGKAAPSTGTAPAAGSMLFQQPQQLAGMHPAMMGMYQMHPQMAQMAQMGLYSQMLMPGSFMMPSMAGMAGMAMPAAAAAAGGGTPGARKPGAGSPAAATAPGQQPGQAGGAGQVAALQYVPMMQYGAGGMPMLLSTMAPPPAAPQ